MLSAQGHERLAPLTVFPPWADKQDRYIFTRQSFGRATTLPLTSFSWSATTQWALSEGARLRSPSLRTTLF